MINSLLFQILTYVDLIILAKMARHVKVQANLLTDAYVQLYILAKIVKVSKDSDWLINFTFTICFNRHYPNW